MASIFPSALPSICLNRSSVDGHVHGFQLLFSLFVGLYLFRERRPERPFFAWPAMLRPAENES